MRYLKETKTILFFSGGGVVRMKKCHQSMEEWEGVFFPVHLVEVVQMTNVHQKKKSQQEKKESFLEE